jgi:hypothetical protein
MDIEAPPMPEPVFAADPLGLTGTPLAEGASPFAALPDED